MLIQNEDRLTVMSVFFRGRRRAERSSCEEHRLQSLMMRLHFYACSVVALALPKLIAQENQPFEKLPQPYRTLRDWAQFPAVHGIVWPAAVTAVEPDHAGHIYVVYRCLENSRAGRTEDPILKFDRSGKLLCVGSA
jgi:hypothetical protein